MLLLDDMTARLQKRQTSKQRHHPIHLTCLSGLGWKTAKHREPRWMICFYLIEFWIRLMRTRRVEGGKKTREKRRETREIEWGRKGREGGRGPLFYSCLEDMAHMRLPNPTGNVELRGKGKTNKANGVGVAGRGCRESEGEEEWAESRVCVSGGAVWG